LSTVGLRQPVVFSQFTHQTLTARTTRAKRFTAVVGLARKNGIVGELDQTLSTPTADS
jgi:hypothetical protein